MASVKLLEALAHNRLQSLRWGIKGGFFTAGEVKANMAEFDRECRELAEVRHTQNLQNLQNQQK